MTITRPLFCVALLAWCGLFACAGTALAQQQPAAASPVAPVSKAQTVASPPNAVQSKAKQLKPTVHRRTVAVSQARDASKAPQRYKDAGRYASHQRGLMNPYQNAVTPPPVDAGR